MSVLIFLSVCDWLVIMIIILFEVMKFVYCLWLNVGDIIIFDEGKLSSDCVVFLIVILVE